MTRLLRRRSAAVGALRSLEFASVEAALPVQRDLLRLQKSILTHGSSGATRSDYAFVPVGWTARSRINSTTWRSLRTSTVLQRKPLGIPMPRPMSELARSRRRTNPNPRAGTETRSAYSPAKAPNHHAKEGTMTTTWDESGPSTPAFDRLTSLLERLRLISPWGPVVTEEFRLGYSAARNDVVPLVDLEVTEMLGVYEVLKVANELFRPDRLGEFLANPLAELGGTSPIVLLGRGRGLACSRATGVGVRGPGHLVDGRDPGAAAWHGVAARAAWSAPSGLPVCGCGVDKSVE